MAKDAQITAKFQEPYRRGAGNDDEQVKGGRGGGEDGRKPGSERGMGNPVYWGSGWRDRKK